MIQAALVKEGAGKLTLPPRMIGKSGERLVAGRREASASGRDCLAGSSLSAQHTALIDTELTGSRRRNTARGHGRGCENEYGGGSNRGGAGSEVVTALHAGAQNAINQVLARQTGHCSITAVAGGRLIGGLSTGHSTQ